MKISSCKFTRTALMLGSASLILGAPSLLAQDASSGLKTGLYLTPDAGVNLLSASSSGAPSFDPGLRLDLSTGYAIKLADQVTLAPELEVGYLYNTWSKQGASGHVSQVPVLGNIILNYQFTPNWTIYGGGGAGCDYADASGGNLNETDFAWQGEAGIRYAFGSSEIGVGYKYLGFETSHGNTRIDNNAIMASYTFHF